MNIKPKIFIGLFLFLIAIKSMYANEPPEGWSPQSQELLKSLISDVKETMSLITIADSKQGNTLEQYQYHWDLASSYKINLGLILEMNDRQSAFEVLSVTSGSLASSYGISVIDEIVLVDDIPVSAETEAGILERIQRLKVDENLVLTVSREGANQEIVIPVSGKYVPQIRLEIGNEFAIQTGYTGKNQELLENLALKMQLIAAAIHENETLVGNANVANYTIQFPAMNKLELGMELDVSEPQNGFKVRSVEKDSLADSLGLKPDDLIVNVNHFEVNDANSEAILSEIQSLRPGDTLALMVNQNNEHNRLTMTVEKDPIPAVNLIVGQHESPAPAVTAAPESFQRFDGAFKAFETTRTSNSRIKSGYDDSLDFSQYQTYGFRSQTAYESPGFHDLLGLTFSAATEQQMLSRGHIRSDNPDVLINVSVNLIDKQRAPNQMGNCPSYGDYYSRKSTSYYRYAGRKQARLAETRRTFCAYSEGSIKVDMVDVKLKRTIWEAVSSVRVDEKEREFLLNGHIADTIDGPIKTDMADVKRRSTFKYDRSRISDDEINRGHLVKGYILDDVAIMFENSPFHDHQ